MKRYWACVDDGASLSSASYNRVCCKGPGMTCGGEGKEKLVTSHQAVRRMCVFITIYETQSPYLEGVTNFFSIGLDYKKISILSVLLHIFHDKTTKKLFCSLNGYQ